MARPKLRYQRSTEEAWEINAKELAERVTADSRSRIGAELILVAGMIRRPARC